MDEKKEPPKAECLPQTPDPPPSYQGTAAELPSYEKAVSDGPPSYSSLYADLVKSKEQCNGKEMAKVFGTFFAVVAGSVIGLVFIGVMVAIPVSMIVIGATHLYDCRAERFIPIYLVVGGSFGLFQSLCNMCKRKKERKRQQSAECEEDEEGHSSCLSGFTGLVSCFLFAWFIAGNVWIYRTYNAWSPLEGAANYCHPTLYWYSFWLITATYIFIGACVLLFVVLGCCFCIFAKRMGWDTENCCESEKKTPSKGSSAQNLP